LRAGKLGEHCSFSGQASQASLLGAAAHHTLGVDERALSSIGLRARSQPLPGRAGV